MNFRSKLVATVALGSIAFTAHGSTLWDESVSGDLSSNGLSPTSLAAGLGSNIVLGTAGAPQGSDIDRDYFSFTVPDGALLSSIMLLPNTAVAGGFSFIGIQPGPQLTVSPGGAGASAMIAFGHYSNAEIGTNILPSLGQQSLPSGTYSFWVQDTGGAANFGFDFQIAPVPLPGAALLFFSGLFGLSVLRRKS
jgi:hypothetical protein